MNFKKKNAANAPAPNQAQQAARRRSLRSGAYASVLAVVVLVLRRRHGKKERAHGLS